MAIPPKHYPPEPPPPPPPIPPAPPPPDEIGTGGLVRNPALVPLPLTKELRGAYQHLYDLYEEAIQGTTDAATLLLLNDAQSNVNDILTKDNLYALGQDTALFGELQTQIQTTNDGLEDLKARIALVAAHIALAGQILAAINKVLSMVPGL